MTGRAWKDGSPAQGESAKLFLEGIRRRCMRESYERRLIVFLSGPEVQIDTLVAKASHSTLCRF